MNHPWNRGYPNNKHLTEASMMNSVCKCCGERKLIKPKMSMCDDCINIEDK